MDAAPDDPDLTVNVALGRPAEQGSRAPWCPFGAGGLVNGQFEHEFNSHTEAGGPAWWRVDLGARLPLAAIRVHNRREMAREAARTLRVEVSEDGEAWTLVHAGLAHFRARGQEGGPLVLPLAGLVWARHVRLSLDEPQALVLSQVEVLAARGAVELIRLRAETGLDVPLPGETPEAVEQYSYRLVGAPGTRDAALIGLSLVLNPALGNGLMQHTMAVALARRLGLRFIRLAGKDVSGVLARTEPAEIGGITFLPGGHDLPPGGWFLEGYFWELEHRTAIGRDLLDPIGRRAIVREVIHPLFDRLPRAFAAKPDDELVVHIRSGDIFSTWVNAAYIQPPLAFYTLVVGRHLAAGRIRRVKLVYENRLNPVIDALEAHLAARGVPFTVQSGTIVDDATALVNARHLVFGFGTLGPAICYLSDRVESVATFVNAYDHGFQAIPTVGRVIAVTPEPGTYVQPGAWANTPEQRRLMVEYPEAMLRVDGAF